MISKGHNALKRVKRGEQEEEQEEHRFSSLETQVIALNSESFTQITERFPQREDGPRKRRKTEDEGEQGVWQLDQLNLDLGRARFEIRENLLTKEEFIVVQMYRNKGWNEDEDNIIRWWQSVYRIIAKARKPVHLIKEKGK